MGTGLISRGQALIHSPALPKVLFVLAVDAATSACLIAWEHAHKARVQAQDLIKR